MKKPNKTQMKVLEALKNKGECSLDQLVEALKEHKTSIRRALESLSSQGLIEKSFIQKGRGRPALVVELTSESEKFFPSRESEILSGLIRYLMDQGHESLIQSYFEGYWEQKYQRVLKKMESQNEDTTQKRLSALKSVLKEDGFYPQARIQKNQVTVKECHCPLAAVAREVSIPCQLEAKLIAKVLKAKKVKVSPMGLERRECLFESTTLPRGKY